MHENAACKKLSHQEFGLSKAGPPFFITETPPFVPHLESLDDTSNFEEFEKIKHPVPLEDPRSQREFTGRDLPFIGFTYVKKDNKLK